MKPETTAKKKPRPDGKNLSQYDGHEKWKPARWAWELLRRQPEYIAACRTLPPGPAVGPITREAARARKAAEAALAEKFGLKKFKNFSEGAGDGKVRARFLSASPRTWTARDAKSAPRQQSIQLCPGQVIVKFDVRETLGNTRAIAAQLEQVKLVLEREQRSLLDAIGTEKAAHFNRDPANFVRHLRVLDLRASGASWTEVARILFPEQAAKYSRDEIKGNLVSLAKEAEKVMARYREVAAMAPWAKRT